MKEEYLDLYDNEGKPTGRQILRRDKHSMGEGDNILVVHLCIFDSRRRMLLQRRSRKKAGWPGLWDFSAGGHVMSGGNSAEAVRREAMEELGFACDGKVNFISRVRIPRVFDDFYGVTADLDLKTLSLQEGEVDEVAWIGREEALRLLAAGEMVPYEAELIEILYDQYTG